MKTREGYLDTMIKVYVVDSKVPFILGFNTMDERNIDLQISRRRIAILGDGSKEIVIIPIVKENSQHVKLKLCKIKETSLIDSTNYLINAMENAQIR